MYTVYRLLALQIVLITINDAHKNQTLYFIWSLKM